MCPVAGVQPVRRGFVGAEVESIDFQGRLVHGFARPMAVSHGNELRGFPPVPAIVGAQYHAETSAVDIAQARHQMGAGFRIEPFQHTPHDNEIEAPEACERFQQPFSAQCAAGIQVRDTATGMGARVDPAYPYSAIWPVFTPASMSCCGQILSSNRPRPGRESPAAGALLNIGTFGGRYACCRSTDTIPWSMVRT